MTDSSTPVQTELRPFEASIPTADGERVAYTIPLMVPMVWEPLVKQWLLTPEAEGLIENTKARHTGILSPAEICGLREQLNLTQDQFAELLKIGEKTWSRWESGRHRPSQSLNLLLRALQTGVLTPYALRQLGQPHVDWTIAVVAAAESQPFSLVLALQPPELAGNTEGAPLAA